MATAHWILVEPLAGAELVTGGGLGLADRESWVVMAQ